MDAEGCGQIGKVLLYALQDASVAGKGPIVIQDQVREIQGSVTRDIDFNHGFVSLDAV